eukprot:gene11954-13930_t
MNKFTSLLMVAMLALTINCMVQAQSTPPPGRPDTGPKEIVVVVWVDANGNLKNDDALSRKEGKFIVTIMKESDGSVLHTETVDISKARETKDNFKVEPGRYCLSVVDEEGLLQPLPTSKAFNDIDPDSSEFCFHTNIQGSDILYFYAGFGKVYSVVGNTWLDDTDNKLADVQVDIKNSNGTVVQSFKTKEDGSYLAGQLRPGDYCLTMTSEGHESIGLDVKLNDLNEKGEKCFKLPPPDNETELTINGGFKIAEKKGVTIKGITWKDLNNNGVKDAGEEFYGPIKATLYKSGEVVDTWTIEGEEKGYTHDITEDGDYTLEMIDESGDTQPTAKGTDNQIDALSFNYEFKLPLEDEEEELTISGGFAEMYDVSGVAWLDES